MTGRKGDYINVPKMLCEFCGGEISPRYFVKRGKRAGMSRGPKRGIKYCSRTCMNRARHMGGFLDKNGYRVISINGRQTYEHTIEMERMLGRELRRGETVHHRNGLRDDNRIENLELWSSRHGRGQRVSDMFLHAPLLSAGHLSGALSFGA